MCQLFVGLFNVGLQGQGMEYLLYVSRCGFQVWNRLSLSIFIVFLVWSMHMWRISFAPATLSLCPPIVSKTLPCAWIYERGIVSRSCRKLISKLYCISRHSTRALVKGSCCDWGAFTKKSLFSISPTGQNGKHLGHINRIDPSGILKYRPNMFKIVECHDIYVSRYLPRM